MNRESASRGTRQPRRKPAAPRLPLAEPRPAAALPPMLAEIEASPAGPRVGAFFDFDGTLIAGYSVLAFLRHRLRNSEIGVAEIARGARSLLESLAGRIDNRQLVARGLEEWAGRRVGDMDKLGERLFTAELEPTIFPEMRAIIEAHRRKNHTLVIATSAVHFQVAAAARSLRIDDVLSTRLIQRRGVLTGKVEGPVLWGTEKAAATREFAAARGVDLNESWFYADGDEDEALMHLVGRPRPTNPQNRLLSVARRRGWPVLRFASRGPADAGAIVRCVAAMASVVPAVLGATALGLLTGEKRDAANLLTSVVPDIALALSGVRLNVVGEENLWSRRPAVFIWNHRNIFDAQIVGKLVQRDFGAVAKKELAKLPLFALASCFMHIAFIDRANHQAAIEALEPATRLLGDGYSMLVAPEGKRVTDGVLGEFKKGAFRMAMTAGVPIVPIIVRNVDVLGPRNSAVARPGTVDVAVLPPIAVDDWTTENLHSRIEGVRRQFLETLEHWPGPISL